MLITSGAYAFLGGFGTFVSYQIQGEGVEFADFALAPVYDNENYDSNLPAGLTLSETGLISGTPTAHTQNGGVAYPRGLKIKVSATSNFETVFGWVAIEIGYGNPLINSGQIFNGNVGKVFSATPAITDSSNRPVSSWSATGLPTGLSINSATGQITGAPSQQGNFTTSITAINQGGSNTQSVQFIVAVSEIPFFHGAIRATAVYVGATAAKAIYYGPSLLWNAAGWEPLTLQNNLLAFYRLNDDGGGVLSLSDSSGNNRTLTNTGGVLLGTGVISGAASFQSPRWLSVELPFNTAQPWAISFWANISSLKNYFTLIGGESTGRLHIHGDSSGRLYLNNGFSDGVSVPNFFTEGQWAHYAFSRSGSTLSVYKNSTLVNTYNLTASYTQTSTLYIGRVIFTPDDFQFVGRMDAIGLWSRAITSAEVSQLYNNGAGMEI